jgi:hypothetical protein
MDDNSFGCACDPSSDVPYDSDLYRRGIDRFRANMDKTLRLFNARRVPVFISTVVSNEKDLRPFISLAGGGASLPAFKENFKRGESVLRRMLHK